MALDSFTTSTSQGFFSRIGSALVGVILGPILIFGAAALIFYNENNSLRVATGLKEGAAAVVEANPAQVNSSFDGKLVHFSAQTATEGSLHDPELGVAFPGVKLARVVMVYEWKESSHESTTTNLAGTKTKTTTYNYEKTWDKQLIDSTKFKEPTGHENPTHLTIPAKTFQAESVTIGGGFQLDPLLVKKIEGGNPLPLTSETVKLPPNSQLQSGGVVYVGKSPDAPSVGDLKITEVATPNAIVSVVAGQKGTLLGTFRTKNGQDIALLDMGSQDAAAMFKEAQSANALWTWVLRGVAFVLLLIGIQLIFGPVSMLASIVPFLGSLVSGGLFVISFLLAVIGWTAMVGIAWVSVRPLVGIPLFAAAGLSLALLGWVWIKRHSAHAARLATGASVPAS